MTTCSVAISLLLDNVPDDPYDRLLLRRYYYRLRVSRSNVRLSPSYRYPPYLHRRTGQTTSCPWDSQSCRYDINGPYLTRSRRPHGGISSQTLACPLQRFSRRRRHAFSPAPSAFSHLYHWSTGKPAIPVERDPFASHQPIFVGRWLEVPSLSLSHQVLESIEALSGLLFRGSPP